MTGSSAVGGIGALSGIKIQLKKYSSEKDTSGM